MPRRTLDLNGSEWQLGEVPDDADPQHARWSELAQVAEWLPATVPGNVQADLVGAGRLPDPNSAYDAALLRRAGERSWWLVRRFAGGCNPSDHAHLVLRGIDYIGDIFLNGQFLGRHEGMFAPQVYDVTPLQQDNQLAVRLLGSKWLPRDRSSSWVRLLNWIEARYGGLAGNYPQRRDTLKCQMGFGWDFAPPLLTLGLWDDVCLAITGDAFIRDVRSVFWPASNGVEAVLRIQLTVDTKQSHRLRLVADLAGETFPGQRHRAERETTLPAGCGPLTMDLAVPEPHLWWPWDHGRPDLYRLAVEVWEGDRLLDSCSQAVGLRSIQLDGWSLQVNGEHVYARGANWVPAALFPGRVTDRDYARLLGMAREANMNLLRVWAGGLREKQAFYDMCDRLGILVWQEFPFACAFLTRFPRSREYLDVVRQEAQGIVRDVRRHTCLALWSGGNEFSPRRNAPLITTLRRVVTREDPSRPFLAASPDDGDHHNWRVWHSFVSPAAYQRDDAGFASEFGLQSPPPMESLRSFLRADELWPPGPAWSLHGAGLQKLWRYARPFLPGALRARRRPAWTRTAPESFVQASQQAQRYGIQIAVEHFRRRKAAGCGGVLVWQLNEPWPAISWAVISFSGQPKPAFEALQALFSPVLVSLAFPLRRYAAGERLQAQVWAINDTARRLPECELSVELHDAAGRVAERHHQRLDLAASSAAVVAEVRWTLPQDEHWLIACRLMQDGRLLSANQYDLTQHDAIRPTLPQRLRTWTTDLSFHL
jgi:beta-mannosidase